MVLGSRNPEFSICPFRARIWPFQAPKTLRFKGKMANFEAKNTVKQGKKRQKDKWYPFHACTGEGSQGARGWGRGASKRHLGPDPHLGVLDKKLALRLVISTKGNF